MGKLFVNPLAFRAYNLLRKFFEDNPEQLKEGMEACRDAMIIVGNICNDDDKLLELMEVIANFNSEAFERV
tara:strand:+ start:43 stop:255 length:213 start_codon:yes stop_codon:yes gene_type:complete